MIWALLGVPLAAGVLAFLVRATNLRRGLLVLAAVLHGGLCLRAWNVTPAPVCSGWLALDPLGLVFLSITSLLFLVATVYAVGYLRKESAAAQTDFLENLLFVNQPEAVFIGCLLLFLATMTLVCLSQHLGVLWVAIEATTLSSAPLIYFHRHHRSLEAAWKYLLICSVGIALALLGNFFLAMAVARGAAGHAPSLLLRVLLETAGRMQTPWLKAAFVFILVGYGTKMGLAPLHTWLPDAHSEAPSVVSALLSGALLNCAFLGILRAYQVCLQAGQAVFAQHLLVTLGVVSMAVAAIFILGQSDFKRMLAYSSVEHMGLMALGVGLGGAAVFGALLHAVNHSLTKAMLFMVAGNILGAFHTRHCARVRGLIRVLPVSGALWVAGFLAISGTPPFGLFLSKFTILKAAFDSGHAAVGVAALALLAVIFVGMCVIVLRMAQGTPEEVPAGVPPQEPLWAWLGPLALGLAALGLGVRIPAAVEQLLSQAAQLLGGL